MKTGGNPLFVQEFFRRIVDDGLVVHNKYQGNGITISGPSAPGITPRTW